MLIPILLPLAAQAAVSAPAPEAPPSEIVVQGTRVGKQQIRDFVRAVTDVPTMGQVARFHAPACPSAMGLPAIQNAAIVERMRRVASAASIGVAREGCAPNVFVIVTPDKQASIEELARRFPAYFSGMSSGQIQGLADRSAPAVAWQVRGQLSADGTILNKPTGRDYYVVKGTENPSRIRAASEPIFVASVVVIDVKAAAGLTVTELADYAAMRTFAAIDPDRVVKTGVPTILGVLGQPDDKPLPLTLSHWDMGFLKALYSTDNAYYAGYQRGDMERVVTQEVEGSGAARHE